MIRCTVISERLDRSTGDPDPKIENLRLGILIPAFNEADHLPALIQACRAIEPAVIVVVDDASSDSTAEVLQREEARGRTSAPLCWVRNESNLGKQGSVRRGLKILAPMDLDAVALIDGDGQHDPSELPGLAGLLPRGYDLVIGARSHDQMPAERRVSNWLVNHCFEWVGGVDFVDVQSGLRIYSKRLADTLAERLPERGRYALEHESLAVVAEYSREQDLQIRAAAAPIRCRYGVSRSSIAGRDVVHLALETFRQALRLRLAAWDTLAAEGA